MGNGLWAERRAALGAGRDFIYDEPQSEVMSVEEGRSLAPPIPDAGDSAVAREIADRGIREGTLGRSFVDARDMRTPGPGYNYYPRQTFAFPVKQGIDDADHMTPGTRAIWVETFNVAAGKLYIPELAVWLAPSARYWFNAPMQVDKLSFLWFTTAAPPVKGAVAATDGCYAYVYCFDDWLPAMFAAFAI